MQKNTCFKECRHRDKKGNFRKTCPDYMETTWLNDIGETQLVEDCARRRTLLLMLNFENRIGGLQKASEQERNQSIKLKEAIMSFRTGGVEKLPKTKELK